ncbi:MAG: hypothetical protein COW63_17930, partial [Bacteroidetes bacterium CG18_big_fil_WC_8_21_14_2_50_41_14]
MKHFTKLLVLMLTIVLSSTWVYGQTQSAVEIQYEQSIHGPTVIVPATLPGSSRAVGDDCTNPIIVDFATDLPFNDLNQTNCGRGNTYSTSCLGSYDGGEDIIYQLNVAVANDYTFALDPKGTTWSGMAVMDGCPDVGSCIITSTSSSGAARSMQVNLAPGTYYLMVDTWPSPNCIPNFNMTITAYVPPVITPIVAFPFNENFDGGAFPAEITAVPRAQSDAFVSASAANSSAYGVMMEGNGSTGWSGGSTSTTYTQAFTNNATHIAELLMEVHPDMGAMGLLTMQFDMRQNYSFGWAYEYFRVLINGTPVADLNGDTYWNPATAEGDPWQNLQFDLTPYQNLASFNISIQNSGKYYFDYYGGGDAAMVDNFEIYYLALGDLQGNVTNTGGLAIGGAEIYIEGVLAATTDGSGFYSVTDVPAGPIEVTCVKPGYNDNTVIFNLVPGVVNTLNFSMTSPNLSVSPLRLDEIMAPNEYLTDYIGMLNTGSGPVDWTAE